MGLDQYVYVSDKPLEQPYDFDYDYETCQELFYWRKHPNLQGWMNNLYKEKGGTAEDQTFQSLQLTVDDLNKLEIAVRESLLPYTTGFFFGVSRGDEAERTRDLEFIELARRTIAEGKDVFYVHSW